MHRKSFFLFLITGMVFYASCKKDDDKTTSVDESNPVLKTGNYWVYEEYRVDSLGVETSTGFNDSVFIEKDTLINGIKYFKRVWHSHSDTSITFWRPKSGKIISNSFIELFPTTVGVQYTIDFVKGLDTIYRLTDSLLAGETFSTVAGGTFKVHTLKDSYTIYSKDSSGIIHRYIDLYTRFNDTVGEITKGYFQNNVFSEHFEIRLLRYKVK